MKIYLDRSLCNDSLPTCERRMARLIRHPMGEDRPCITAIEEDGKSDLTLVMKSDGREITLVLDQQGQEMGSVEGFSAFLPWTPAFNRSGAN